MSYFENGFDRLSNCGDKINISNKRASHVAHTFEIIIKEIKNKFTNTKKL